MTIFKPAVTAAALLAGACSFGAPETAEAGGFSLSIGRPYGGYGYGGGFDRGYRGSYYGNNFNRGYYGGGFNRGYYGGGFGGTSVYDDTSHVDVINGRRVFHQSGHFDHYGPGHFGGHGGFGGQGGFGGFNGHHH